MYVTVATKTTEPMPDGLMWPAVAVSEMTSEEVEVVDRNTGEKVTIVVTRADFISLRETREGVKYLALTSEVVNYGRRIVALPRFSNVVGLDVTEDGVVKTLADLMADHEASYSAFQKTQFDTRRAAVSLTDLLAEDTASKK